MTDLKENQMSLFDFIAEPKKKTNLDVLKEAQSGMEFLKRYEYFNHGCRQHGENAKEIWKKHCLTEEYRGLNGCERCKAEFWDSEYEE